MRREFHDILHIRGEFRALHVIGIAAKRRVTPASIDRILPGAAQPAEPRQVRIFDAGGSQNIRERFLIELGILPGTRHGTHIKDMCNFICFQQIDKSIQ